MTKSVCFVYLLFCLLPKSGLGQEDNSRFSITPHFALGILLPGTQEVISGNERMSYMWRFYNIGYTIDASGNKLFNFKTTNKIGFDINYRLNEKVDLNAGVNRKNVLSSYRPSLQYNFQNQRVDAFFEDFNYMFLDFGITFKSNSLYYVLNWNYIPDIDATYKRRAKKISNVAAAGDYTNANNTGLKFQSLQSNNLKQGFYLGIGQETLNGSSTTLELGFSFALAPRYKDEISFYSNGSLIGQSTTNHLLNTVFVTVRQSFNFRKKEKVYKRNRIEDREVPEESAKVEVGTSRISVGQNFVLEAIQFDQSSADLNSEAVQELNSVLTFLNNYPKARIEISGHTSDEGDRNANIALSEKRAEECKRYLTKNGIASRRVQTLGFGPDKPLLTDEPELNRRVELKILSLN